MNKKNCYTKSDSNILQHPCQLSHKYHLSLILYLWSSCLLGCPWLSSRPELTGQTIDLIYFFFKIIVVFLTKFLTKYWIYKKIFHLQSPLTHSLDYRIIESSTHTSILTEPPFSIIISSSTMAVRTLLSKKTLTTVLRNDPKPIGAARGLHVFTLPDLAYDYGALEPVISGEIMQIHHQKHHQTYITNYNKALEQLHDSVAKADSLTTVKLQNAIKFNGGG